jgi:hypothetical protein
VYSRENFRTFAWNPGLLFQLPPAGLGFVPGPRLSSECRTLSNLLERALAQKVGFVRRRDFLQHLLWVGAVLASWSALDAERMVAAAAGHVDRRLLDDLHAVADDYARRMHTEAPRDLLPRVERHLTYVRGLLRSSQPSLEGGRLHLRRDPGRGRRPPVVQPWQRRRCARPLRGRRGPCNGGR